MDKGIESIRKFLTEFPEEFKDNILTGAVNETLKIGKEKALENVTDTYFISKKEVSKTIKIKKARKGIYEGFIDSNGPLNSIDKFKVKYRRNTVLVGVRKDKGLQERNKSFSNYVRKFSGNDGHYGNKRSNATFSDEKKRMGFRRSTSSKYPIQRLTGPAVPQLLSSEQDVVNPVGEIITKNLEMALEEQVLKKFKKQEGR